MIKERTIPGGKKNKPNDTEYYLLMLTKDNSEIVYNDWYSPNDLIKLKGCTVNKEGLLTRIRGSNPLFNTLENCIFHKKVTNSDKISMRVAHEKRLDKLNNKTFYEDDIYAELHLLWSAGSLHKQHRIMGSK